ncbi:DoxX family protein [Halalkalicoccus subterraneus]|uniref:DoxX family protein n=1 Tax=Halalkalicoccus subterraneus TaxID=2675002 RepID=UPI000EFACEB2|nr:DoxX family protein [Halalkalicoccus subterraneus]
MTTTPPKSDVNVFESNIAGITLRGRAHSLSAWFVLALRLMMGFAFLYAGLDKLLGAEPFSAQGYLLGAVPANGGPLVDLFVWMGETGWMLTILDIAVPFGQVAIGLGLLVGAFTRLAAFFGAFMMVMFYFANWDVAHGLINGDFAYMLVFLAVAAFGAGRILGLDAIIERYEIDGTPLIEKYPKLDYVLG